MSFNDGAEARKCKEMLREFMKEPGNKRCADCVKSATMDNWNFKLVEKFKAHGGNVAANSKFEALLPKFIKLDESSHSDSYKVATFIRNKYVKRMWYKDVQIAPKKMKKPKVKNISKPTRSDPKCIKEPSPAPASPVSVSSVTTPSTEVIREQQRDRQRPRGSTFPNTFPMTFGPSTPMGIPETIQKHDSFVSNNELDHFHDVFVNPPPKPVVTEPVKKERRLSISRYLDDNDLLKFDANFATPFPDKTTNGAKSDILSKYNQHHDQNGNMSPSVGPQMVTPLNSPQMNGVSSPPMTAMNSPPLNAMRTVPLGMNGMNTPQSQPMNPLNRVNSMNAIHSMNSPVMSPMNSGQGVPNMNMNQQYQMHPNMKMNQQYHMATSNSVPNVHHQQMQYNNHSNMTPQMRSVQSMNNINQFGNTMNVQQNNAMGSMNMQQHNANLNGYVNAQQSVSGNMYNANNNWNGINRVNSVNHNGVMAPNNFQMMAQNNQQQQMMAQQQQMAHQQQQQQLIAQQQQMAQQVQQQQMAQQHMMMQRQQQMMQQQMMQQQMMQQQNLQKHGNQMMTNNTQNGMVNNSIF